MAKFSQHHCNVSCTDVVIAAAKRATESADRAEAAAETAAQDAVNQLKPQLEDIVQKYVEGIEDQIPVIDDITEQEFKDTDIASLRHGIYVIKDAT